MSVSKCSDVIEVLFRMVTGGGDTKAEEDDEDNEEDDEKQEKEPAEQVKEQFRYFTRK